MKKLFLDLDGVIINTNKFIQEEIYKSNVNIMTSESLVELCKKFPWDVFLKNATEIKNSYKIIKKLNKIYDLTIITHYYSELEKKLKIDFIKTKFKKIKYVTVPYVMKKSELVLAKNNILVDDYYNNISSWNQSGGIGLYFNENINNNQCLTINSLNCLLDEKFIERMTCSEIYYS